jgi:P pilus assembly chaperone PapD
VRKILLAILFLLLTAGVSYARIGVGVGTGKIEVDQKLKPGIIYQLPPLTVVNTGDEVSDYKVGVSYHEKQTQLEPPEAWFRFSPKEFNLEPGKVQVVNIKLDLPVNAKPGQYFTYLEGQPIKKSQSGATSISIAAAAKLYFEVVPANLLQGIYYKLVSFWNIYQPWTSWAAIAVGFLIVVGLAKKFLNIEINLKGKKDNVVKNKDDE